MTDWAVVVGINHYRYLQPLEGPHHDADRFERWLVERAGVDRARVASVRSTVSPVAPTRDPLCQPFLDIRESVPAGEGGRLWIYVAGHGIVPDIEAEDTPVLLAANAKRGQLCHHLDLVHTARWFRYSGLFREVILFADCCRNEAPRTPRSPTFDYDAKPGVGAQTRYFAGFATRWSLTARERPGEGGRISGIFTDAVIAALEGAVASPTGEVLPADFRRYVRDRVRAERPEQEPEFDAPDDELVLARVAPPPPLEIQVDAGQTVTVSAGAGPIAQLGGPGTHHVVVGTGNYKLVCEPGNRVLFVSFPDQRSVHVSAA